MNIYVVTEGRVEAIVYRHWIPLVNSHVSPIDYPDDVDHDNFYIVSAKGYPDYFRVIGNAIQNVNKMLAFDRLVISVDSEDMTRQAKYAEISAFVAQKRCVADVRIVVQHFCFETWALGNRKIIRREPSDARLREYKSFFNVRVKDPELLPSKPDEELSRVRFAQKYLRRALRDKHAKPAYSKRNPRVLVHEKYFAEVSSRLEDTGHIASFSVFLAAFV